MNKPKESEINQINDLKSKLINTIRNSLTFLFYHKVNEFKNKIINLLEEKFDEFIKDLNKNAIKKQNANIPKRAFSTYSRKVITFSNNLEPNYFTPIDIQKEYKNITNNFLKIAMKRIKDDEIPKNKNLANFLKDVAYISRKSYNNSKTIYENMKNELKSKINDVNNGFSIWIKNKEKYDKNLYQNYFNEIISSSSEDTKDYIKDLYNKLLILYFHCELSFPPIKINFKVKNREFDGDTMIDFFNYGKGDFQFVYFPSLHKNDDFLEKDSKLWVYIAQKDEFHFNFREIRELNN